MRPGLWIALVIVLATGFTNLGAARLWDRDEPRNAQCAREMMEADNWVVPTFDGQLRTHKPALLYWGQITAYRLFGVNEWSARLPSALAGVLTALLVYWTASRLTVGTGAAWSAISLATMLLFVMAIRAATPDALLVVSITAAIALFVRFAYLPSDDSGNDEPSNLKRLQSIWPSWPQWTAVYGTCGVAVLAKGPVGLLLPIAVIGLATLMTHSQGSLFPGREDDSEPTQRGWNGWSLHHGWRLVIATKNLCLRIIAFGWRMRPITAVLMTLVVAGPWYLAVGLATDGLWLREFFFTHNVSRAVSTMEGHSGPPLLFYAGALLVGTFPWSCFATPLGLTVWYEARRQERLHPLFAISIAWIAVFVGAFSLASTKLPSYITPCYPGAALLVGWYVAQCISGRIVFRRWLLAGLIVAAIIGLGLAIAIGGPLAQQIPSVGWVAIAGVIFSVASLLAVGLGRRSRLDLGMRSFVIGAVSMVWLLHSFGPAAVDSARSDLDSLQQALADNPTGRWWIAGSAEPSWIFYSNRRVIEGLPPELSAQEAASWGRIIVGEERTPGAVPKFMDDQFVSVIPPEQLSPRLATPTLTRKATK